MTKPVTKQGGLGAPGQPQTSARVRARRGWQRRLLRSPLARIGFFIIAVFLLVVLFAPFIAPYSPTQQSLRTTYIPPGVGVHWSGPDGAFGLWVSPVTRSPTGGVVVDESERYPVRWFVEGARWTWFFGLVSSNVRLFGVDGPANVRFHLLGTDEQGRDVFSRLVHGAWISLFIGLIAVAIGIAVGVPIGALSGYHGGTFDLVVQRFIDVMLAFPGILLAIVLVATFGTGLTNVMIAVGIASIPIYARLVRGSVLSVRSREYIEAAKALGKKDVPILIQHVIPNALAPIIVQSSLQMAVAILFAAGLGFLGLGARPPQPEWGLMLARGREYLATAPHVATFPGLAIILVVLGFNLVGDALRDALDPRRQE
ncbi:ABC transporter permease [Truepera radiovictrix]|uniref:Binding-protein-dependent transport systems inner membrane component n=1 Tax=Truepera radiovictrix (strain DSM 17093 / CIP 108686 / LMG 22925 / RQ-24) TaxID=649638 RepID=D7CVZ1_TRURR|nr:ABC transporter permease [Truepera radiovictrix]ADI14254.1 binding-protein-dependent transport systems inner membrane component [Truepera radiovictrix DSM 17093]WMT57189.1 ABC transporter permease [Truepera radiovictrix]